MSAEPPWTPTQTALIWLSDAAYKRGEAYLHSNSGSDQSESELWIEESRLYQRLFRDPDLEKALAESRDYWRWYAAEVQAKIDAAPKIKYGGYAGASWLQHRYVDPEAWERHEKEVRRKVEKATTDPDTVIARKGLI